jgi:hypothetical protein
VAQGRSLRRVESRRSRQDCLRDVTEFLPAFARSRAVLRYDAERPIVRKREATRAGKARQWEQLYQCSERRMTILIANLDGFQTDRRHNRPICADS